MPREVSWGTPGRAGRYVQPRGRWIFLKWALAAGIAAPAVLAALHLVGWRRPVSPGALTSPHVPLEARCEECHAPRGEGASDLRCRRCHDTATAGRLTTAAHVIFGSGDPLRADSVVPLGCARCHVEHRGREQALASVDQSHCTSCHFRSLAAHPEFALLREPKEVECGLNFDHARHVREVAKRDASRAAGGSATCGQCHQRNPVTRDFDAISFDAHCATCHAPEGHLAGGIDPLPVEDALPPRALLAAGVRGAWLLRTEEYEVARGKVARPLVRHRDEWVLHNLRRLRSLLDPAGLAAERTLFTTRITQLERRLALFQPMASLDLPALNAREAALAREVASLEARLAAQAGAADPVFGFAVLESVADAAAGDGDAAAAEEIRGVLREADALRDGVLHDAPPLGREEHSARRGELLLLLDAIERADPAQQARVAELRRRLLALRPGEPASAVLQRLLDQRRSDIQRVRDELGLRARGIKPPRDALMEADRRAIGEAIRASEARLADLGEPGGVARPLDDEQRARKEESAEILAMPCMKCHVVENARMAPALPAKPVLRGHFRHEPHIIQVDCGRCHAAIEKSQFATDVSLPSIGVCRECHTRSGVNQTCQTCHRYHPPAVL